MASNPSRSKRFLLIALIFALCALGFAGFLALTSSDPSTPMPSRTASRKEALSQPVTKNAVSEQESEKKAQQSAAIPLPPVKVEVSTMLLAQIEELKLRTQLIRENAAFTKAQADTLKASAELEAAKALQQGISSPYAHNTPSLSQAEIEALITKQLAATQQAQQQPRSRPKHPERTGPIVSIQGHEQALWALGRNLLGQSVRLEVGDRWNDGKIIAIQESGVTIRSQAGTRHIPF